MATPSPIVCAACKRAGAGKIECRGCGRRLCKHFTGPIVTEEGKQYDPLRDPIPKRLIGMCPGCRMKNRGLR